MTTVGVPPQAADVVVVGAGLAGYSAAIAAAEAGATVLLLEKQHEDGGSALMSGGSFAFAGTDLQRSEQIDDSPELLYRDLISSGGPGLEDTLIRAFVDQQLECYDWMRSVGIQFKQVSHSGGQSVPRSHGVDIGATFDRLRHQLRSFSNVSIRFDASPHVINQIEGHVSGVTLTGVGRPDDAPEIEAAAVILTTGGFSRSDRLLRVFAPRLIGARQLGGRGNSGDGIVMAMALGAELSDVGEVKATFGVSADVPGMPEEPTLLNSLYRGGIVINSRCERFVDESISYKLISDHCLAQPGGLGVQIFDEKVMDQTIPGKIVNDYAGAYAAGYLVKSDSLADLARQVGLDPASLEKVVRDYNSGVIDGIDRDFGRTHLSSGFGERALIDQAPYYAYRSTAGVTSTYGGLRVGANAAVLHVLGGEIPGLYAAGEIMGGFHGKSYMSGSSLTKSVLFGRVAGHNAAAVSLRFA